MCGHMDGVVVHACVHILMYANMQTHTYYAPAQFYWLGVAHCHWPGDSNMADTPKSSNYSTAFLRLKIYQN